MIFRILYFIGCEKFCFMSDHNKWVKFNENIKLIMYLCIRPSNSCDKSKTCFLPFFKVFMFSNIIM